MTVVETDRLTLRHFTPDDAEFILRLLNEPSFHENIGDRGVRTLEQAVGYLADGPIKSYEQHGHGLYLVVLKETGQPIGMCGLIKRETLDHPDVGYAFLPEFWSRGFAYESASAVLDFGRRELAMETILAIVSPANAASIGVLRKLGFAYLHTVQMKPDGLETAVYELNLPASSA
jgi:ribosomal-protein-alanine N-acetyltransferase